MTELVGISALLLVFLTILLAGGVWIAVALMATGYVGMQFIGGGIPSGPVLATTIWGNSNSWTLAALPLFIWMGEILFRTRLSEEMFRGLAPWLNRIPGRLMHVNVLACGIFGSVSGSSAATCATVAKIALPELKKRGYDEMVSLGSLAGAGTLGILIPPSITMVVYAVAANVSIIQIFLAGFLPGFLVMALYSGYIAGWSLAQSGENAAGRTGDDVSSEIARVATTHSADVADPSRLSFVDAWLGNRDRMRRVGRDGIARDCLVARRADLGVVLGQRHGNGPRQLHDHADPGGRLIHVDVDGVHRDSGNTRELGRQLPSEPLCADRRPYGHVHRARDGARRYFDDRADDVDRGADDQAGRIRPHLVRDFRRARRGNGGSITPPVGFNLFVLQTMSGKDSNTVARASLPFFFLLVVAVAIITVFPDIVMVLPRLAFPG